MNITDQQVAEFQRDGVILLRGVFTDWIPSLRQGVAANMDHPSPLERSYQPKDGSAAFFQDYLNWSKVPEFRSFVFDSPAGAVAARLMQSPTARFFHDHVLVKRPGNSTVTPWHQDAPYYCVEGEQSVSFWTPLDPVSQEVALQCVAGSHRWTASGFRPKRFDGSNLYAQDDFEELPDIDANRSAYDIRVWKMEPGDVVAFDFRTVHGAAANNSPISRRVFSTRWVGADARYVKRTGPTSPPLPNLVLSDGAPFDAPEFPVVYPRAA